MKTDEVDLICEYAANNLEDWLAHSKQLNEKAANLIVRGLRACGWNGLSHCDTTFMTHLAKYLEGSDPKVSGEAQPRKRKPSYIGGTSKRHHGHMTAPDLETPRAADDGNAFCEDQLNDTLLDWDFDINLSLDWDQFIEDQITEAVSD